MTSDAQPEIIERNGTTYVVDPVDGELEVRYGLPANVTFCSNCVISNQRAAPSVMGSDRREARKATIYFGEDGVCEACRVVERKDEIDWDKREADLRQLLDRFRSRNGSYDCLVPGSGGKDSAYAAHMLKSKFGMRPLTVTWAPHMYTDIGWQNFTNWIHQGGFDNYLFTANGLVQRKLTELAYRNLLHPFQPFTLGQRNFPVKIARQMNIPLVFYGENAAEYGAGKGEDADSQVPIRYLTGDPNKDYRIGGLSTDELAEHGISQSDLSPYMPITEDTVRDAGIEAHYLGHFLRWTPQECFYYAVDHTGFSANPVRTEGTFSKYNSIDDKIDGFHYWCGFIKFGIGRCTHEASQEIRHKHIEREEGVALVHRFDGEFPARYFPQVLEYLNMEEAEFMEIADSFRSPHLWKKTSEGWQLRHRVG